MPKIVGYISIGLSGCRIDETIEVDDAEWSVMSKEEQDEYIEEFADAMRLNYLDYGAYIEDERY
mgnify:CR=1 FL=1